MTDRKDLMILGKQRYGVGDSVFLNNPARKSGTGSKFHLAWAGPFVVVKKISDLVYGIQKSYGSGIKFVHHDRLNPARVQTQNWLSSVSGAVENESANDTNSIEHSSLSGVPDEEADTLSLSKDEY